MRWNFVPWRLAVPAAAVALVASAYAVGSVMGQPDDPPTAAVPTAAPGAATPASGAPPVPSGAPTPPASTSPETDGRLQPAAAPPPPVTGPGRPPLAHTGSGPFGTRRTTGADYAALTFDDGPDPRWTPQVLDLLRDHQIRATFCVVGAAVESHPELVRAIVDDGHTVCNHSWNHDVGLGHRPRSEIRADLQRTNEAIRAAAPGTRMSYYRQPGGNWTPEVVAVAEEMGMSSLHWDVDPQDWRQPGASAIASAVTSHIRDGSIVLLHDGGGERHGTVAALGTLLVDLIGRLWLDALPVGVDPPADYHGNLSF